MWEIEEKAEKNNKDETKKKKKKEGEKCNCKEIWAICWNIQHNWKTDI